MDGVDHLALSVVLGELELRTDVPGDRAKTPLDVAERFAAIHRRLTRAEKIEIRTVEDGESHVFFSPLSHALNCAMSSGDAPPLLEGSAGEAGRASVISSEKN
jgi:hypothetical protein